VTTQFFSLNLGEAGRTLDRARWALEGDKEPSDATKWLTSLYVVPEKRLYDAGEKTIKVTVKHFYKMKSPMPAGTKLRIGFSGADSIGAVVASLPMTVEVPVQSQRREIHFPGDRFLTCDLSANDGEMVRHDVMVSFIDDLKGTYDKLVANRNKHKIERGLTSASMIDLANRIDSVLGNEVVDTDIYAELLLNNAIMIDTMLSSAELMKRDGDPYTIRVLLMGGYLNIPAGNKSAVPARVAFPEYRKLKDGKPRPLVFALHGAGGSENMFVEGYGDGQIVKECDKRGWMLVCPRSPLTFGKSPPIKDLLESLKREFPIDERNVFVVGHSMGAMQTIAACQENPGLFRAAAAMGGGGRVTKPEAFKDLPVYIAVGDKDFALPGAKALNKALTDGGAKNVTYKEYPDLEHLVIVRESLPDIFKMFDEVLKKDK
jgi:predicted esterase